jgi:hypothetical protein
MLIRVQNSVTRSVSEANSLDLAYASGYDKNGRSNPAPNRAPMTFKKLMIITAIWTAVVFVVGGLAIWYIGTHPISGVSAQARGAQLGTGLGTLASIGYACIWLPYAAKVGQQKRAEREKKAQQKKKKRRR